MSSLVNYGLISLNPFSSISKLFVPLLKVFKLVLVLAIIIVIVYLLLKIWKRFKRFKEKKVIKQMNNRIDNLEEKVSERDDSLNNFKRGE